MLLSMATWQEVEARLQSGKRGIIIPIGSHEQHGPTGLIGTDALCPDIIARHADKQGDLLIAPPFSIGMAQHHMGFPGSIWQSAVFNGRIWCKFFIAILGKAGFWGELRPCWDRKDRADDT